MPYKWLTRVIALLIGVISPFIIGRRPTLHVVLFSNMLFFSDSHPLKLQPVLSESNLGYTCHILPQQQICVLYSYVVNLSTHFSQFLRPGGMFWMLVPISAAQKMARGCFQK